MSHGHHYHGLNAAFWLALAFALVELAGGWFANSLALLADAGHMVSDVAALGLAMVARTIAGREADATMTYGYGRARVLAAQVSALMLWLLCIGIVWEGVVRLLQPPPVQGGVVVAIAVVGLLVNLVMMRWLHGSHDINSRAAYWHVLGDALGSLAAIVAGGVIMLTGWMAIDPLLSFLVAAILAWGGWRLVCETTRELMAAVPRELDCAEIVSAMERVSGVQRVYHIHIWKLPSDQLALSAHVEIGSMTQWPSVLSALLTALQQHGIDHATLQPDPDGEQGSDGCR